MRYLEGFQTQTAQEIPISLMLPHGAGRQIIAGSIQTRNYEKQDGTKGFSVDIVADEVEFLSSKNDGSSEGVSSVGASSSPVSDLQPVDDDTLPF